MRKVTTAWEMSIPKAPLEFWILEGAEHLRKFTYFLTKNDQQTSLLPTFFPLPSTLPMHISISVFPTQLHGFGSENNSAM